MSSSHAEELESLLRTSNGAGASDLKPLLTRLASEVRHRTERSSIESYDFFSSAAAALSKIKGSSNLDLRLDCHFNAGQFFCRTGYERDALSTVSQMRKLAIKSESKPWLRKASLLAGIVHGEIGDVTESVIRYAEALALARELSDAVSEGAALIGLSSSLNYGGLYHEGLRCAQRAASIFATIADGQSLAAHAYTNMAQSQLSLEDFGNGFSAIQVALRLSEEVHDGRTAYSRCVREFTYVHLALELGKLEDARHHAELCRRHGAWGNNPKCKVLAAIAVGLSEIKAGDVHRGFAQLDSALAHSFEFPLKVDSLTALVKAYDELNDPERALEYLKQLLAVVRAARDKGLSALISVHTAEAGEVQFLASPKDLSALELREAKLEAKVAKRDVFNARMEMLERLAIAADLKEEDSGEHGYRVGRLSYLLARDLGWDPDACVAFEMAARLHDIGKVGVPDRILFTSQVLRDAEREFISAHTVIGSEMLAKSDIPHLRVAQEIALHHHEWWNGEGYPSKLIGKRIPIHARIVALADVFDALTHGRPFARPWSTDAAIAEIVAGRGTQFDPELTDLFLALVKRLIREHPDLDGYLGGAGRNSPFLQARSKIRRLVAEKQEVDEKSMAFEEETG